MAWLVLLLALAVILVGAELFTNGVEWVGTGLGLSEGAVGSVLAAVGTALPETILPIVAIVGGKPSGDDIGIGAILGAPFMLTTLVMFALGLTVVLVARRGGRGEELEHDPGVLSADLAYFLVMYALALAAGLLHVKAVNVLLSGILLVGYGWYVRRHFASSGGRAEEAEAVGEVRPLRLMRLLRRPGSPSIVLSSLQTLVGLGVILGGAQLFVDGVDELAHRFSISHLVFSLLVAPLATELPEALNASVIWARRGKDVLAVGNITGAMVFQVTFPVIIGLLFTPWRLNFEAGVAAGIALLAGGIMLVTVHMRGALNARLLLLQGLLYLGYVAFVLTRA